MGWGAELGTHFSLLKLGYRKDFAPYVGGGVGIDYVFSDRYGEDTNKRNSGFSLNAKAGLLAFRTYNFNLLLDAGYKVVLNTDLDQALTANIGVMWKRGARSHYSRGSGRSNPFTNVLAVIGGITVSCILLGVVLN